MEISTGIEIFENTSSDKILLKINKGQWQDIYDGLCIIHEKSIKIDYSYFKYFATKNTYPLISTLITNNIDTILLNNNNFTVYVNMKSLTFSEIEKHMEYIQFISILLRDKYPGKLFKCYIYNPPFIFSQLFNIISFLIDKETISKIELIQNK
jgi:hypothetical protein